MTKKEFLIIFILAVLVTTVLVFFIGFPLRITNADFCLQPHYRVRCEVKVDWTNAFLEIFFWFVVLTGSWQVLKRVRKGTRKTRKK